jgi:hypothetical protein
MAGRRPGQLKAKLVGMKLMMLMVVTAAALGGADSTLTGCTAQQAKAAGQEIVKVAVDACQEAPNLIPAGTPAGTIVALVCAAIDTAAPAVTILLAADQWNAMKAQYLATHGKLPDGMSPPTGAALPPGARQ